MSAPVKSPVAGDRFRAALALKDPKLAPADRKLLALVGAFADAGESSPSVRELARRTGLTVEQVDAGLERLSKRRHLWINWSPYKRHGAACYPSKRFQRNIYYCRFAGDPLPEYALRVLGRPAT